MPTVQADGGAGTLLARLAERIRRDGPMPVDRYMQACLDDPEHGFWQRADTIGAGGDFITAPEISQVFGELIGLWAAVAWEGMGRPAPLNLVELGPGRGTLMADALRAAKAAPGFIEAVRVHLVEASGPLRQMQRAALAVSGLAPAWHRNAGDVPSGAAIIIANEFLDALPIRQLVFGEGAWRERVVDLDPGGGLRFALVPAVDFAVQAPPRPGAIVELRAGEAELLAALAERGAPLAALFIDYGPEGPASGDTLQAVRRHAYADPLSEPGTADLTAHVQFAALAKKARAAGLAADGPLPQGEFLGRLGIAERAARLMAANPVRAGEIEAAVQRLVSPTGMGQLFKALAVRSPALSPPVPFG
jgi:NADH dehydrogenase [ubiquinone] 1 alpha subcomplex assembly factor 7